MAINLESGKATTSKPDIGQPAVSTDQTQYLPVRYAIMIFCVCASIDFVAMMDQTMLAGGLSQVTRSLNAGSQASWISGAFFLTSTAFQLLYGRLSDVWSRKFVLLGALLLFFLGSLAASLAQNATQMIVFRAFTGVGGGGLMTVAQTIIGDVVSLRERGKYQGILGVANALANGVGPVVGGALASASLGSWRWIFRLNLPLSAISLLASCFCLPLKSVEGSKIQKLKMIDWLGAAMILAGSTLLVTSLTWAGVEAPWASAQVLATFLGGLAVVLCFIGWQWKCAQPLVNLEMFKSKLVVGACLTTFLNGWNGLVQVYFIPLFYQLVYGYSLVKAASLLLPITITQSASSTLAGFIVSKSNRYRECIIAGWVLWAVSLGLFSSLGHNGSIGKSVGYALLTGIGVGLTFQPTLIAAQAGCERKYMATVTSVRSFVRNLGGTLGLAVAGTIHNNVLRQRVADLGLTDAEIRTLQDSPSSFQAGAAEGQYQLIQEATMSAFRMIFWVGAGLATLAVILAVLLMPQVTLERPDDKVLKEKGREVFNRKGGSNQP